MAIRSTSLVQINGFSSVRPVQIKFTHFQIRYLDNCARLIQECTDLICISICDIFNQSISQGIFLDEWKCAKVVKSLLCRKSQD